VFSVDRFDEITRVMMGSEVDGRIIFSVAAYLIDGLLIDTGCHHTRRELVSYLSDKNISFAVNTHHHVDHIGANKLIKEKLKVPLFAPQESLPIINRKQDIFPYQEKLWGYPEPCEVEAVGDTFATDHYTYQVVRTSGHSRDHVVFFLREKGWLFTGDEFLTEKPNSARKNEDHGRIVKALYKMLALKPELLATSSGEIYRNSPAILERTISYFEEMRDKVHMMRGSGLTSQEIAFKLFGEETSLKEFTSGQFSRENFIEGFFINNGLTGESLDEAPLT